VALFASHLKRGSRTSSPWLGCSIFHVVYVNNRSPTEWVQVRREHCHSTSLTSRHQLPCFASQTFVWRPCLPLGATLILKGGFPHVLDDVYRLMHELKKDYLLLHSMSSHFTCQELYPVFFLRRPCFRNCWQARGGARSKPGAAAHHSGFSSCRNCQCARCGAIALTRRRRAPCIHNSSWMRTIILGELDSQITDDQETWDKHSQSLLSITLNLPCVLILEIGNERSAVPGPSPRHHRAP